MLDSLRETDSLYRVEIFESGKWNLGKKFRKEYDRYHPARAWSSTSSKV